MAARKTVRKKLVHRKSPKVPREVHGRFIPLDAPDLEGNIDGPGGVLETLSEILNEAKEQGFENCELSIEAHSYSGEMEIKIYCSPWRLETPAEVDKRLKKAEKEKKAKRKEEQKRQKQFEAEEKRLYLRLKKKFEEKE